MSQGRAGRPEAAAAIWDWRGPAGSEGVPGGAGSARLRGALRAAVVAAAGLALLLLGFPTPARLVFGVAALVLLAALLSPTGLYFGLERLFAALGRATGRVLTWVLMTPLFYLFFLPFGLLFRRGRRDRLRRFVDPSATTYWEPHDGPTAASGSQERQY